MASAGVSAGWLCPCYHFTSSSWLEWCDDRRSRTMGCLFGVQSFDSGYMRMCCYWAAKPVLAYFESMSMCVYLQQNPVKSKWKRFKCISTYGSHPIDGTNNVPSNLSILSNQWLVMISLMWAWYFCPSEIRNSKRCNLVRLMRSMSRLKNDSSIINRLVSVMTAFESGTFIVQFWLHHRPIKKLHLLQLHLRFNNVSA